MDSLLQAWLSGFAQVFEPTAFGLMCLAIVIGFLTGIIPFVSVPMVMALMLPFTFSMKPVEAFSFLLGMLSVNIVFSDITSIIFGVPGEPSTASVLLDGHPMAKQGQTGRALGAVLTSSLVGAIIGAVLLAAAIPIVLPITLAFGSPEFFALAILGILSIAALSRGNITKGVVAGVIGLLLSTVGLDPQSGTQRYTFGLLDLWDGVGLVPVTVGLFGVAELTELWIKQRGIAEIKVGKIGGVMEGVRDCFRHFGLTVRCSLLGTVIGIFPGLGGTVGQWLAYAHALQSARDRSRFGKGDVRGVIGPGATMNAKEGGNLLTTVAFGIPASVTMAILLGAFIIQGVVPGPAMLTTHLDLTMSFVWVNIVSHIISVALCFLFLNQMVKITEIRSALLLPPILMLALLGGFADRNSAFDMVTSVVAGFIGMAMVRLDWPRPPLILGLVLGRIVETNLFISYSRYGFTFLERPLLLAILVIGATVLLAPMVRRQLARRFAVNEDASLQMADDDPEPFTTSELSSKAGVPSAPDFLFGLCVLVLIGWMVWEARDWPLGARFVPLAIGIPGFVLALLQMVLATRRWLASRRVLQVITRTNASLERRRTLEMALWILGFTIGVLALGFRLSAFLLPLAFFRLAGRERWRLAVPIALGTYLTFAIVFARGLDIPFPNGMVADWFGIQSPDIYLLGVVYHIP